MKLYKFLALAATPVLALTACTDEVEYTPTEPCTTPAAYFAYSQETFFDLNQGDNQISLTVYRAEAGQEATANITSTAKVLSSDETGTAEGPVDFFNIPTSVKFAEGANSTKLVVDFPFEELNPFDVYELNFKIDDSFETPYVMPEVTVQLTYIPWVTLDGKATLQDCIPSSIFTITSNQGDQILYERWEVTIQEHPKRAGYFRLVDPYSEATMGIEGWLIGGMEFLDADNVHYVYINAEDPEGVYVPLFSTYFSFGSDYGAFYAMSEGWYSMTYEGKTLSEVKGEGLTGTYYNKLISMPRGIMAVTTEVLMNDGRWGSAMQEWRVELPGYEDIPEVVDWETIGTGKFVDGFIQPAMTRPNYIAKDVTIQQSTIQPTMYRVLNAWGQVPDPKDNDGCLVFDITEPTCVVMPITSTGIVSDGSTIYAFNIEGGLYAIGQTYEDIIESLADEGLTPSTYENGVVTIPADNSFVNFSGSVEDMLQWNKGMHFTQITMPTSETETTSLAVSASRNAAPAQIDYNVKAVNCPVVARIMAKAAKSGKQQLRLRANMSEKHYMVR